MANLSLNKDNKLSPIIKKSEVNICQASKDLDEKKKKERELLLQEIEKRID